MKSTLGTLSFVCIAGGLQGIVHEAFGRWIPLMGFMKHLYAAGYEIPVGVALIALGIAVGAAARRAHQ